MAFPDFIGTPGTYTSSGAQTAHAVPIPADPVSAGMLIVVFLATNAANFTSIDTAGYTSKGSVAQGTDVDLEVFCKVAAGGEESTNVDFTSGSANAVGMVGVVDNWKGSIDDIEFATASGASGNPDSPNLDPAGGALDILWLSIGASDVARTLTTYPSNYDSLSTPTPHNWLTNGGGSGVAGGWGVRELNAGSENPGAYVLSASDQWCAVTLAIPPVAAGGGRIMSSLARHGGLAGQGGIAGQGGGLAG